MILDSKEEIVYVTEQKEQVEVVKLALHKIILLY